MKMFMHGAYVGYTNLDVCRVVFRFTCVFHAECAYHAYIIHFSQDKHLHCIIINIKCTSLGLYVTCSVLELAKYALVYYNEI